MKHKLWIKLYMKKLKMYTKKMKLWMDAVICLCSKRQSSNGASSASYLDAPFLQIPSGFLRSARAMSFGSLPTIHE